MDFRSIGVDIFRDNITGRGTLGEYKAGNEDDRDVVFHSFLNRALYTVFINE